MLDGGVGKKNCNDRMINHLHCDEQWGEKVEKMFSVFSTREATTCEAVMERQEEGCLAYRRLWK